MKIPKVKKSSYPFGKTKILIEKRSEKSNDPYDKIIKYDMTNMTKLLNWKRGLKILMTPLKIEKNFPKIFLILE